MDALIFFAVIIFFSIIESISRSRKAQRKIQGEEPADPELFPWAQTPPGEAALTTYDEDRSYDDAEKGADDARERVISGRPEPAPDGAGLTGAEVAADIWAEIKRLGMSTIEERTPQAPAVPGQSPALPEGAPRPEVARTPRPESVWTQRPAPRPRPLPQTPAAEVQGSRTRSRPEHRVHLSHEGYGTDPSERAPSEQDGLDPLAAHLGEDAAAVRTRLLSHDASALRQAIVLQEVLGPPAALQGDRFEE
jgi:hypothetical protein